MLFGRTEKPLQSTHCFVLMPFKAEYDGIYIDFIKPVLNWRRVFSLLQGRWEQGACRVLRGLSLADSNCLQRRALSAEETRAPGGTIPGGLLMRVSTLEASPASLLTFATPPRSSAVAHDRLGEWPYTL